VHAANRSTKRPNDQTNDQAIRDMAEPATEQVASSSVPRQSLYDSDDDFDEEHGELIEWPGSDASFLTVVVHVSLLPLKFLLWATVPDVRHKWRRNWYMASIASCVGWLAVLSFVMSISVEALAHTIGISDTVAGLTISAAGTSFPNVFASMIVARQGLGNMAVSNAMGSNVFNIFMGLGLPWLLYCLFPPDDATNEVRKRRRGEGKRGTSAACSHLIYLLLCLTFFFLLCLACLFFFFLSQVHASSHVYHGLAAPAHHGVLFPTLLLLVLLLAFTAMLFATNFRLYKWHAYLFSGLYCCFLVWAFGWSCKSPDVFSSYVSVNGNNDDDDATTR
jgi:Ca2+/Na+ antiporter